ncbi:MAG: hypothetical protein N3A54_05900 [Patescibacteria group bacterium]|nr:hypothetical protein [Patescibacteria group bacterium]
MKKMKPFIQFKVILILIICFVIGGLFVSTVYFYQEYQKVKKNPDLIIKQEMKVITDSIQRFMNLPTDEEPTLATVTDKEKLSGQEFFKNAQNGDKVLLYAKAKKAILYRPSTGRVVEFAPLILGVSDGTTSSAEIREETTQNPVTIAIYNGTKIVGITSNYENAIQNIEGVVVKERKNAVKKTYTNTLVVDINGSFPNIAKQIAEAVKGEVASSIPEEETKPDADILVIAAKEL